MAELALKWEHDRNGRRTWKTLTFAILPIHHLRILGSLFSIKCVHAYIHIHKCIRTHIHQEHIRGFCLSLCLSHTHTPPSTFSTSGIHTSLWQRPPTKFDLRVESGQQMCFIWPVFGPHKCFKCMWITYSFKTLDNITWTSIYLLWKFWLIHNHWDRISMWQPVPLDGA